MNENAVTAAPEMICCRPYDWRSWRTWGAVILDGTAIGFLAVIAVLVSELVVRDMFGMTLGSRSLASADLLAAGIACLLIANGTVAWIFALKRKRAEIGHSAAPTRSSAQETLLQISVFAVWAVSAGASIVATHFSAETVLAMKPLGTFTGIAQGTVFAMGIVSLRANLERLGARPLTNTP